MSYNSIKAAREGARLTSWKDPVRIAIASSGLTLSGEQTLQSVALTTGDAVLVLDGVEAGIRVVQSGAWGRREDARVLGSLRMGTAVRVTHGTYAGGTFRLDTDSDIEPGVTSMTWTQDAGGGGGSITEADLRTASAALTANLDVNNKRIVDLAAPSTSTDAATLGTVEARTAKLAVRARMPAQTTIPSTLVTDGGVTAVALDRILLDSLTTQADRGIYAARSGSAWTRVSDFDSSADIANGALILVTAGTDAGKLYQLNQLGATLGTTALTFSQVGGGGSYTAGDGLTLTGSDFDVDLTDTAIFTTAGAASRVPVLTAGSILACSGVEEPGASCSLLLSSDDGGAATLSAGFAVNILSPTIDIGDGTGTFGVQATSCAITAGGAASLTSSVSATVSAPTTTVAATTQNVLRASDAAGEVEIQVDGSTERHRFTRNALYVATHGAAAGAGGMLCRPYNDSITSSAGYEIHLGGVAASPTTSTACLRVNAAGTQTTANVPTNTGIYAIQIGGLDCAEFSRVSNKGVLRLYDSSTLCATFEADGGADFVFRLAAGMTEFGIRATPRIYIENSAAVPGSNPTNGGYLYVESGALKFRGSSGTVTTIAPA